MSPVLALLLSVLLSTALASVLLATSRTSPFEVFAFLLETEPSVWAALPWHRITTVCLAGWLDPALVTTAHSAGVKVVFIANYPKEELLNATHRTAWVGEQVAYARRHGLDGVNFDFEDPLAAGGAESRAYTRLVKEAVAAFHREVPGTQVSVDVAWAPGSIDGRGYQYGRLGRLADRLFVMGYDEQSQMWGEGPCRARANSPLRQTFQGVREYLRLGVHPGKLILGVPWYGYRYPCELLQGGLCTIREVPFRGCNCTDAAGKEFPYSQVLEMLALSEGGREWDGASATPTFTYREGSQDYQVWYDDPQSLAIKYQVAKDLGLAGTGFWTANYLNYSDPAMVDSMWSLLPK